MPTTALFPVSVEHRTGFIDAKGRVRIPPRFDFANLFSEGLALVGDWDPGRQTDPVSRMWKAKHGFINSAGEVVVPRVNSLFGDLGGSIACRQQMCSGAIV
jgi:hypothetical protein